MNSIQNYFNDFLGGLTGRIGINLHNLLIGIILALILYFIYKFLNNILDEKECKIRLDSNIKKIIRIVIKCVYTFFSVMFVASIVGINTSSLIAAFSVLGIAISLSVQQIMGNVANSFAIFINKPFKVGDHVKVNDMEGTIHDITFVNTKLLTYDNDIIIIPNNIMGNAIIYNFSLNDIRRIVLEVGISYKASSENVRKTIIDELSKNNDIIKDKGITVTIKDFADSSVTYAIRFYSKNEQYLVVLEKSLEDIKNVLEKNNIEIPYPIRVIEINNKN